MTDDEILKRVLNAAGAWNDIEARRISKIEEEMRAAQEKKEKEEEKLADAVNLVRTIDEFTAKWYPVAGMTDMLDEESYIASAKALIRVLDSAGPLGLGMGLF